MWLFMMAMEVIALVGPSSPYPLVLVMVVEAVG